MKILSFQKFKKLCFRIFISEVFDFDLPIYPEIEFFPVITGSTDGIGKSYSFELASRGFNIFLVSRTQSRLDTTKSEIQEEYPDIEIRTAAFDFTTASASAYRDLLELLNQVDIGVLVNNVGMFYEYPDEIHRIGIDRLADVVTIDTLPPTLVRGVTVSRK